MREERERLRRENEEMRRYLQQTQQSKQEDDDFGIDPDDFIDGKKFKKYHQQNTRKIQELESRLIESQLKSSFPDFEKVVNEQTVARLRQEHPDLASTLGAAGDKFYQASAVYKMIKNMGIYSEGSTQNRTRVEQNASKPRSAQSTNSARSTGPLSQANAFAEDTPAERRRLYQEMMDFAKNK